METAIFGAGCFWGVETAFRKLKGVIATEVGYTGGHLPNPTYEEVCTNRTGHAEVVKVQYDSSKISYEELLKVFFQIHDPTMLNRQGPDIGTQYRSVIFYTNLDQEKQAKEFKEKLDQGHVFVTEILPATDFYRAEEYHQRYHEKQGGSCFL